MASKRGIVAGVLAPFMVCLAALPFSLFALSAFSIGTLTLVSSDVIAADEDDEDGGDDDQSSKEYKPKVKKTNMTAVGCPPGDPQRCNYSGCRPPGGQNVVPTSTACESYLANYFTKALFNGPVDPKDKYSQWCQNPLSQAGINPPGNPWCRNGQIGGHHKPDENMYPGQSPILLAADPIQKLDMSKADPTQIRNNRGKQCEQYLDNAARDPSTVGEPIMAGVPEGNEGCKQICESMPQMPVPGNLKEANAAEVQRRSVLRGANPPGVIDAMIERNSKIMVTQNKFGYAFAAGGGGGGGCDRKEDDSLAAEHMYSTDWMPGLVSRGCMKQWGVATMAIPYVNQYFTWQQQTADNTEANPLLKVASSVFDVASASQHAAQKENALAQPEGLKEAKIIASSSVDMPQLASPEAKLKQTYHELRGLHTLYLLHTAHLLDTLSTLNELRNMSDQGFTITAEMGSVVGDDQVKKVLKDDVIQALLADGRIHAIVSDPKLAELLKDDSFLHFITKPEVTGLMYDAKFLSIMKDSDIQQALANPVSIYLPASAKSFSDALLRITGDTSLELGKSSKVVLATAGSLSGLLESAVNQSSSGMLSVLDAFTGTRFGNALASMNDGASITGLLTGNTGLENLLGSLLEDATQKTIQERVTGLVQAGSTIESILTEKLNTSGLKDLLTKGAFGSAFGGDIGAALFGTPAYANGNGGGSWYGGSGAGVCTQYFQPSTSFQQANGKKPPLGQDQSRPVNRRTGGLEVRNTPQSTDGIMDAVAATGADAGDCEQDKEEISLPACKLDANGHLDCGNSYCLRTQSGEYLCKYKACEVGENGGVACNGTACSKQANGMYNCNGDVCQVDANGNLSCQQSKCVQNEGTFNCANEVCKIGTDRTLRCNSAETAYCTTDASGGLKCPGVSCTASGGGYECGGRQCTMSADKMSLSCTKDCPVNDGRSGGRGAGGLAQLNTAMQLLQRFADVGFGNMVNSQGQANYTHFGTGYAASGDNGPNLSNPQLANNLAQRFAGNTRFNYQNLFPGGQQPIKLNVMDDMFSPRSIGRGRDGKPTCAYPERPWGPFMCSYPERDAWSPMTKIYACENRNSVRCSGTRTDIIKVDALQLGGREPTFRPRIFKRICYNILCKLDLAPHPCKGSLPCWVCWRATCEDPPCSTKWDGRDKATPPYCGVPHIDKACHDLARPYQPLNALPMADSRKLKTTPEGTSFGSMFGRHRPYPVSVSTGKELGQTAERPNYYKDDGHYMAYGGNMPFDLSGAPGALGQLAGFSTGGGGGGGGGGDPKPTGVKCEMNAKGDLECKDYDKDQTFICEKQPDGSYTCPNENKCVIGSDGTLQCDENYAAASLKPKKNAWEVLSESMNAYAQGGGAGGGVAAGACAGGNGGFQGPNNQMGVSPANSTVEMKCFQAATLRYLQCNCMAKYDGYFRTGDMNNLFCNRAGTTVNLGVSLEANSRDDAWKIFKDAMAANDNTHVSVNFPIPSCGVVGAKTKPFPSLCPGVNPKPFNLSSAKPGDVVYCNDGLKGNGLKGLPFIGAVEEAYTPSEGGSGSPFIRIAFGGMGRNPTQYPGLNDRWGAAQWVYWHQSVPDSAKRQAKQEGLKDDDMECNRFNTKHCKWNQAMTQGCMTFNLPEYIEQQTGGGWKK